MKHCIRSLALLASFSLSGAVGAEGSESSPPASPAPTMPIDPDGQAQTLLRPEPALKEQFDRTRAFLEKTETEVDEELSSLRTEGQLDRRGLSTIQGALDKARRSMRGMTGAIEGIQQVDGWTARMMAFELGMAADTLAQQADEIERDLSKAGEGNDGPKAPQPPDPEQRQLADTLRTTSKLLRETAVAIAHNLKQSSMLDQDGNAD